MPKAVKVVVSKRSKQDRRGARIKSTNITAIECVDDDSKYLNPMIIWPASPIEQIERRMINLDGFMHYLIKVTPIPISVCSGSSIFSTPK